MTADTSLPLPDTDLPAAAGGGRQIKLGERIALRIKQGILEGQLPPGTMIGTLPELMIHFGISRATLREATRQLERQGIAAIKRGVSGGLVVKQPATDAAKFSLANYLELSQVPLWDLFEFRAIIERSVIARACARITDADCDALREQAMLPEESDVRQDVKRHFKLGQMIAKIAGNPASALLLEAVNRVTVSAIPELEDSLSAEQLTRRFRERKLAQVHAIINRDTELALAIAREDNQEAQDSASERLRALELRVQQSNHLLHRLNPNVDNSNVPQRIAHRLAVTLSREIVRDHLQPGTHLGCEPELLKKYGVSRSTFREAVRVLELHGIVATRRGNRGGLVVSVPDSRYTEEVIITYLQYIRVQRKYIFELWCVLLEAAAPLAAARITRPDLEALDRLATTLQTSHGAEFMAIVGELQQRVIEACHNRTLTLVTHLPMRFGQAYKQLPPTPEVREELLQAHLQLLAALHARAAGQAIVQMQTALDIMNRYWSTKGHALSAPAIVLTE